MVGKFVASFSIRIRFIAIALGAGLAMLCMTLLLQHSINSVKNLEDSHFLVMSIERDLLLLLRNEKDFLSRLDLKYRDAFNASYQQLNENKALLNDALVTAGLDLEHLRQVEGHLAVYEGLFHRLVNDYNKLGFDANSGLQGALLRAVHEAEERLQVVNNSDLTSQMLMLRRHEKDFLLRRDMKYLARFEKDINKLLVNSLLPKEIAADMQRYQQGFAALVAGYEKVGLDYKSGVLGELREASHQIESKLELMVEETALQIEVETRNLQRVIFGVSGLFAALLIGGILAVASTVIRRVNVLNQRMADIANGEGDLTVALDASGKDELAEVARNFNSFLGKLRDEFGQISTVAQNLTSEASNSSDIAEQTKQGATRQYNETEQVSAAINQMSASIQNVSNHIRETADVANQAAKVSDEGRQVVQRTVEGIHQLANEVKSASDETKKLEQQSNNIDSVLDVIRGIAEQTNLLALNAAIEAARAGESGRGFAVVADEVRALSLKTQKSTEDIQVLIEALQRGVNEVVASIDRGLNNADQSVQEVQQAADALSQIQTSVAQISGMSIEIASAAQQQETVADEINRSVHAISSDAEQTQQSANDNAETAGSLLSLAQQLSGQVNRYKY